jgi:hypothetical protein
MAQVEGSSNHLFGSLSALLAQTFDYSSSRDTDYSFTQQLEELLHSYVNLFDFPTDSHHVQQTVREAWLPIHAFIQAVGLANCLFIFETDFSTARSIGNNLGY